ncbi:MAG TPA: TIGR03619 family F420-dependent LLM class oxidoreductase [Ilumatobacteraceae bacterium]
MFEREDQLVELSQAAEAVGMRGVALQDHVALPVDMQTLHPSGERIFEPRANFVDPLITAATVLASTSFEVLSYVYVMTMREPITAAKQVGTLSMLSGNRFRFGVGVGWLYEEISQFGYDPKLRGKRFDEMLEIMSRFWRDGEVEYHGRFFDFPLTAMYPIPEPRPPMWIGGDSEVAFARAVRHDGWMGMAYDEAEMLRLLGRLAEHRREAGREHDETFEVFIAPNFGSSLEIYAELSARGVTSTLGMAWYPGDQSITMDDKRRLLAEFAKKYIHTER